MQSIWDKCGPKNTQKCIGKIDLNANTLLKNNNYDIWTSDNGFTDGIVTYFLSLKWFGNINNIKNQFKAAESYNDSDILHSVVKNFGLLYFLDYIATCTGLIKILEEIFPNN
jgi:hypothetical protein